MSNYDAHVLTMMRTYFNQSHYYSNSNQDVMLLNWKSVLSSILGSELSCSVETKALKSTEWERREGGKMRSGKKRRGRERESEERRGKRSRRGKIGRRAEVRRMKRRGGRRGELSIEATAE
jgi:hypothetical protein